MPPPEVLLVAALAVFVGAVVQGAAGFGLGLVAAPVLALVDPALVPVALLVVTAVLPLLTVVRELGDVDWRGAGWSLLGRLPGTVVGVAAVASASPESLALLVAVAVLLAVAASLLRWRPVPTRRSLLVAGALGGAAGTATSVGGPPMILLYQDAPGPRVRATLAVFFAVGIAMSLGGLAIAGEVQRSELVAGALLLPAMLAGFALSGPLRRHVDGGRLRPVVLVLVTLSALTLLLRSLL